MNNDITVGFDYSHNNMLTLEASSYADFTQFLFSSSYKLGKIEAGFYSLEKLKVYNLIIMSTPKNVELKPQELEILEQYVRSGGSLFIIGSRGGDYLNRTNLNTLTQNFGFEFANDEIFDSVNYVNLQKRPILSDLKPHYITENVQKIVLSSGCSLEISDDAEKDKLVETEILVNGGLNCWRNLYDGEKWNEEDSPKRPLLVASEYHSGKVVAFGTLSIFSSLGREYGFSAFDNDIILANIIRWLTVDIKSIGNVITIELQRDLFHWLDSIMKKNNWGSFSDIINVSLKYFKDNYNTIIKELEKIQVARLQKSRKVPSDKKEKTEEEVIELLPQRKKEDLVDIISAIEEISGEKYELSINFDEDGSQKSPIKKINEELPKDFNDLTVKQLKNFCERNNINLPSNARKSEIIKVIHYVLGLD